MEDNFLQRSRKWIQNLATARIGYELEARTMEGLKIVEAQKGFLRCNFIVTNGVSDKDGNWQGGALATLVDNVGAAAIFSDVGHVRVSLDFNISYYSTAKIQEEVEIVAKVVGAKDRLSSVIVEVRRKNNGELIALAKQWMASHNHTPVQASKL